MTSRETGTSSASEAFLDFKKCVARILKSEGFRKSGLSWNKHINDLTQVLTIQKSKFDTKGRISFTMNMGFASTEYLQAIWPRLRPKSLTEAHCFFKLRLPSLIQQNSSSKALDKWWELGDGNVLDLVEQVSNDVIDFVIPFFEKNQNKCELEKTVQSHDFLGSLDPGSLLQLALFFGELGKPELVNQILACPKLKRWEPQVRVVRELVS